MSIESKAKTIYELTQKRKEWLEDFSKGALGNQEAYTRARDTRSDFEQGVKYVKLEEAQKLEKEKDNQIEKLIIEKCTYGNQIAETVKILAAFPDSRNFEPPEENDEEKEFDVAGYLLAISAWFKTLKSALQFPRKQE